jgi:hypothetical protein
MIVRAPEQYIKLYLEDFDFCRHNIRRREVTRSCSWKNYGWEKWRSRKTRGSWPCGQQLAFKTGLKFSLENHPVALLIEDENSEEICLFQKR